MSHTQGGDAKLRALKTMNLFLMSPFCSPVCVDVETL